MSFSPILKETSLKLATVVKPAMAEKALSLRQLSKQSGVSVSTLSRVLSGKQTATIKHLQVFSSHLDIPLVELLRIYNRDHDCEDFEDDEAFYHSDHIGRESAVIISRVINDILGYYGIALDQVVVEIKKELEKCTQYARTATGRQVIQNDFPQKLERLNGDGIIIDRLKALYELNTTEETLPAIRAIAGSALLYLLAVPDVIPDFAFPIGYLDDAIAVVLTINHLKDAYGITIP